EGLAVGEAGEAVRARSQVPVEPAAVLGSYQEIGPPVAVAIPVRRESDRREPAPRLRSAGNRRAGGGREPPDTGEDRRQRPLRGIVAVVDDGPAIRTIHEAREEVQVTVPIPVVGRHRDPAPVRLARRQREGAPSRSEAPAADQAVPAEVLVALQVRLDAALEEVQVAVAVEIAELVEVARGD